MGIILNNMKLFRKLIEWIYLHQKDNLVYYDTLTGCHSRAYYDRVLKKKYIGKQVFLIFVDINNLKSINDTYGHHIGSKYIIEIIEKIKNIRIIKDICRYGGDEFILLSDCFSEEIISELDKIEEISYGYCMKGLYQDFSECMTIADKKMYKMKLK